MRSLFTPLIVALAILFGSIATPVLAGADHVTDSHAFEIVDADRHAQATDSAPDSSPDFPNQAGEHHHCTVGVFAPKPQLGDTVAIVRLTKRPARAAALVPWATLPATEPPAA